MIEDQGMFPEEAGHDHVMRTIIEIPSVSSIHFLQKETRPFFTGRPEGVALKLWEHACFCQRFQLAYRAPKLPHYACNGTRQTTVECDCCCADSITELHRRPQRSPTLEGCLYSDLAVTNNDIVTVLYYNASKFEIGGTRSLTTLTDQVVTSG